MIGRGLPDPGVSSVMGPATTASISSAALNDRRNVVRERLRALGRPRSARRGPPPPQGQLGADEQPVRRLRSTLAALGPVFADFGRYLSSRIDLLPRRDCLELAGGEADRRRHDRREPAPPPDVAAFALRQLGASLDRRFFDFDPAPCVLTRWTQQHHARLAPAVPITVTIVRPDAERLLGTDVPLLPLLGPWLDMRAEALAAAVEDFSHTLRLRLDQTQQSMALIRLAEDARAGGALEAPICYRDYCTPGILTTERIDGGTIADAIDRRTVAQRLALAWLRQAVSGRVVPFDFDLRDVRLCGDRLVLVGGALEPQTTEGREQFLRYLAAAAADDPDAAWDWVAEAAVPAGSEAQSEYRLRCRLRQAVPFRDGEWSGDDRLAEQLLVQWRATREAGWKIRPHQLHLYRGIQAVAAATAQLAPEHDALLAALQDERLRLGLAEARRLFDLRALPVAMGRLLQDMVQLPQKLDDILTMAAEGRLRVKLHVPDAGESRRVRNRTVSLVASLVTLVGVAFLVRHLAPAYGADVERVGAMLLLIVGGWLLVAASRL
jgi:predicted unusual protein kinase regulating ubiquinone biosynthesis (AarF/ABC1/UbiB family)